MAEDYLQNVPNIYKPIINILANEITEINWKFAKLTIYDDKKNIDLFNEFGPEFFVMVRNLLVDSIMVNLCNVINESPKQMTFGKLFSLARQDNKHIEKIESLKLDFHQLLNDLSPIKKQRDKRIGHFDISVTKQRYFGNNPLPAVSYKKLLTIKEKMNSLFENFVQIFTNVSIAYETGLLIGDTGFVLQSLKSLHNINRYIESCSLEEQFKFNQILYG